MLEQLRHLVQMADHPAVTLQILPFHAGPHAAMGGPFTILRFAEPDLHDVVYIEQLTSALYLDKPSEVDSYLEVMEQLCLQAEPAGNTVKLLNQILADIAKHGQLARQLSTGAWARSGGVEHLERLGQPTLGQTALRRGPGQPLPEHLLQVVPVTGLRLVRPQGRHLPRERAGHVHVVRR